MLTFLHFLSYALPISGGLLVVYLIGVRFGWWDDRNEPPRDWPFPPTGGWA